MRIQVLLVLVLVLAMVPDLVVGGARAITRAAAEALVDVLDGADPTDAITDATPTPNP